MLLYDEVDADTLQCFHEMALANLIFYAMKEGSCSELSARMTAMDSASKNAGKGQREESVQHHRALMTYFLPPLSLLPSTPLPPLSFLAADVIKKLELTYNRTRQAVITRELIEIISGAAAV